MLSDPLLVQEWKKDLAVMSGRVKAMSHALYNELLRLKTPGTWNHITSQIGMFSYTGLTKEQVKILIEEYNIYLMDSGRISIDGCKFSLFLLSPTDPYGLLRPLRSVEVQGLTGIAGDTVNTENVKYVAKGIDAVARRLPWIKVPTALQTKARQI